VIEWLGFVAEQLEEYTRSTRVRTAVQIVQYRRLAKLWIVEYD